MMNFASACFFEGNRNYLILFLDREQARQPVSCSSASLICLDEGYVREVMDARHDLKDELASMGTEDSFRLYRLRAAGLTTGPDLAARGALCSSSVSGACRLSCRLGRHDSAWAANRLEGS